jgi:glycerate kinase
VDETSFAGKVVGHVVARARSLGVPVGIVAGDAAEGVIPDEVGWRTLVALGGSLDRALQDAARLAADAAEALARTS